ncbi:MAG TPA: Slp family lipoprotein [Dokdonella sp.]
MSARRPRPSTPLPAPCLAVVLAALALGACATPVFKQAPAAQVTPLDAVREPQRHAGAVVVWGGKILDVRNLADETEVQLAAYPLDSAQRPQQSQPVLARVIVVLPGFADPLDFPPGRFVTVLGRLDGTRTRRIGDAERELAVLRRDALHLWPVNFPRERSRVNFGIGIGVGIR